MVKKQYMGERKQKGRKASSALLMFFWNYFLQTRLMSTKSLRKNDADTVKFRRKLFQSLVLLFIVYGTRLIEKQAAFVETARRRRLGDGHPLQQALPSQQRNRFDGDLITVFPRHPTGTS